MTNILVTGCAGFIGSHLCERLLSKGHTVTGIDNFDDFYHRSIKERNVSASLKEDNFIFIEGDLSDSSTYQKIASKPDVIVHLAAKAGVLPSLKDPQGYIQSNIIATQLLLEYMRENDLKKLIFTSSSSVYGNNKSIPFKESDAVDHPISPYAFTKKSGELLTHNYHHLYDIDVLNLRLFTVYGPRQRPDLAIHKFVKLIGSGQGIKMYGDGSTARDYTFVQDTVSGFEKAIDYIQGNTGVYEVLNLGNNNPVKLSELIDTIYSVMGQEKKVEQLPMQPGDVDITYASIEKAKQLLGYQPTTSIKEGVASFITWYNAQKH